MYPHVTDNKAKFIITNISENPSADKMLTGEQLLDWLFVKVCEQTKEANSYALYHQYYDVCKEVYSMCDRLLESVSRDLTNPAKKESKF